ncbi:MAG TPA: PKD domain-containing protein, partial [Solirubrobacteraceae bacterium]|nr:PKD domain-containing protein [Solirubrobacteraceae bacterium]
PNGSTADPGLFSLSHEHSETITDPLGDGWIDGSGNEDGDLCIDTVAHPPRAIGRTPNGAYDQVIAGGHYWLQGEWSNATGGCVTSAPSGWLRLRLPRTITAGQGAVFSALASRRVVSLRWSFGDGANRGGFRTVNTFRRAGRYQLTVRGTDSFGNWVFARSAVRVRAAPVHRRRA